MRVNDELGFFLWDYLKECGKKIVLFGTGDGADKILKVMECYELKPVCFTATGDFGMKPDFRGYPVLTFEEVEKRHRDFIILICFGSENPEVLERLYSLCENYEVFAPDLPVISDIDDFSPESFSTKGYIYTPDYVEENEEKLSKTRKMLADEKSKEVFDSWLAYRLSGKTDILEQIASPRDEIISLLKLKDNEHFIDAGAYKGDTVDEFLAATNKKFKKITAIEPDIKNYTALRRKFYAYGSGLFAHVNAVAWNEDSTIDFTIKSGRAGGVGIKGERVTKVNTVKIDTLCQDEKPTYIKLDVEGAEAKVIEGAKAVITKHRPKMIVSLYHRTEDMFELPLLINSLNPKYKLYLRKTRCLPGWEFQLIVTN